MLKREYKKISVNVDNDKGFSMTVNQSDSSMDNCQDSLKRVKNILK